MSNMRKPWRHSAALFGAILGLAAVSGGTPAGAVSNAQQVLMGGNSMAEGSTVFTAPGLANHYGADFPGPGLGATAAQIRMPAGGIVKILRVKVTTASVPDSGNLTVTVMRNGANTTLACQVSGTGTCNSNVIVNFSVNDRIAIRVSNNFVGSGLMTYTYSLLLD
jgi:hypothetical protein